MTKSASRALSIVIAKYKSFEVSSYTKLYEKIVWSTLRYGAAVWGTRQLSCINLYSYVQLGTFSELANIHQMQEC